MVRYNGRQKLLTSTLNTNQIGLKMSGTAPSVGSSISARRYTKRRVRDNLKFCGPVYYHGQLWSHNSGDSCVKRAPKNQSLAGGVGRINNPRTKCNIKCMSDKDYDTITFSLINIRVREYDDDDNLIRYTDKLGNVTERTFDERGNMTAKTDALGRASTYEYDDNDNFIREVDPLGNETRYEYDTNNNLTGIIDPQGNTTRRAIAS